jgi:hypothetical protein
MVLLTHPGSSNPDHPDTRVPVAGRWWNACWMRVREAIGRSGPQGRIAARSLRTAYARRILTWFPQPFIEHHRPERLRDVS